MAGTDGKYGWPKEKNRTASLLSISLFLVLLALLGCASQLRRSNPSPTIAEIEDEEQQQKSRLPTITYRPGG
jgi:hypothetical protein